MATININENETINVELGEQSSPLNTTLKDINYIPSYKESETERRANETKRIANENSREEYINDLKERVSKGEFNGEDGIDGKDGVIQYAAGNGIKIENNVISSTGGGSTWGSIEGTLSEQTDLQEALNSKANTELLNNKADKSDIPTKVSDLNNDSEFITITVDNLTNYYKKSEIYTQQEVNTLISNVNSFNVEVVQTLPAENMDTHTIYLVPKESETNDNYDEYIYISNSWEHIGSTSVDLTNYYNKTEIDKKLENKANTSDLESKQDTLVSGKNIKTINNNSLMGSGNIDISGSPTGDTLPIGAMIPYGKAEAPANWLVCDGSEVSRTTYAELFAVIGTSYGEGDGSTTFNLPNKKGKVSVGLDTSDTDFNAIGKTGGEKIHAHIQKNRYDSSYSNSNGNMYTIGDTVASDPIFTESASSLQPYEVDNWIIKAFQSSGLVANVSNTRVSSQTDTYSCDYINGTTLYENADGSNESITLSDSKSSYKYIEISYFFNHWQGKICGLKKIEAEATRTTLGMELGAYDTGSIYGRYSTYKIEQNTLTVQTKGAWYFGGSMGADNTDEGIFITKVVGYK